MLIKNIAQLSRFNKQIILIICDIFNLSFSLYLSFVLRYNELSPFHSIIGNKSFIFLFPIITIPLFIRYGLYRAVLKHIGGKTFLSIFYSISISTIFLFLVFSLFFNLSLFNLDGLLAINWFTSIVLTFLIRYFGYWFLYAKNNNQDKIPNLVIYGAGEAGIKLSESIQSSNNYNLKAFIDDDKTKVDTVINSLRVYSLDKIEYLLERYNINIILLAIPSLGKRIRKGIIDKLLVYPVKVQELPSIEKIIDGKVEIDDISNVDVTSIIGREIIEPIDSLLNKNIENKNILITGAGGSIGSELSRQVIKQKPKLMILIDHSEYNLYKIHHELQSSSVKIVPILSSIHNKYRLNSLFEKFSINTVYHAAAYKHVPMVESNACDGVWNNIIGTKILVDIVYKYKIQNFIFISTDKAVRPTNIMGATKRFCELILQSQVDRESNETTFSMVRFGNVLDSAGSVLPLFRRQIREGGPITVTDPKVIRYFMSIPEAVQLVIQAGAMANGGEVFLLDMGEPINILKMAKKMIHLSGLTYADENNPNGDIQIKITGLRAGEKLYEELLIGQKSNNTLHPRIMMANEERISYKTLMSAIEKFNDACQKQDELLIKKLLREYVEGYVNQNNER